MTDTTITAAARLLTRAEMARLGMASSSIRGSDGDFEWAWTARYDGRKWSYIVVRDHVWGEWIPRNGVRVPRAWSDEQALEALYQCLQDHEAQELDRQTAAELARARRDHYKKWRQ